jgi:hypothetical protein
VYEGDPQFLCGAADRYAIGDVVQRIDRHVHLCQNRSGIGGSDFSLKHAHLNRWIDFADLFGSLLCFGHADIRGVGQGLTI